MKEAILLTDGVYFTNSYKDWNKEALPDNVKVIEIV